MVRRRWKQKLHDLKEALWLSLCMVIYGVIGVGPTVCWWFFWNWKQTRLWFQSYVPQVETFSVDQFQQEKPFIVFNETVFDLGYQSAQEVVLFELQTFFGNQLYFSFYIPVAVTLCVPLKTKLHYLGSFFATMIGYVLHRIMLVSFRDDVYATSVSFCLPNLTFLAYFYFLASPLGTHSCYVKAIGFQVVVFFVGVLFQTATSSLKVRKEVLVVVLYPVTREFMYICARFSTRSLYLENKEDASEKVHRNMLWFFFIHVQTAAGVYGRLLLASIDNTKIVSLLIVYQAVLELFMRISLPWREKKVAATFDSRLSRRFSRKVADNNFSQKAKRYLDRTQLKMEHKDTTTMILTGEMLSEYLAMFLLGGMFCIEFNNPLATPYQFYANQRDFFETGVRVDRVVLWLLPQLLSEIVVDVICVLFEKYRGYDMMVFWKAKVRWFPLIVFYTSFHALTLARWFHDLGDDYKNCQGIDICYCANGRGLSSGGLAQAYCDKIHLNHTTMY